MPAYFINGVFTDNEPAWHGAGIVVPDEVLTMARVFDLVPEIAAPVVPVPLLATHVTDTGDVVVLDVDDRVANTRMMPDGTAHYIATVSNRYQVVQNTAAAEFANAILGLGPDVATVKTAGVIGERAELVWFLLDMGQHEVAGEPWERFLMVGNDFSGKRGLFGLLTNVRVVCQNTADMAIRGATRMVSIRHTGNAVSRADEAAAVLGVQANWDKALATLGATMAKKKVKRPTFEQFVQDLLPYDVDAFTEDGAIDRKQHVANVDSRRFDLTFLHDNVPNLDGIRGTAWGALQATIEWQQRYAYPDRTPAARLMATVGANDVNTRALDLLLKV